MHLVGNSCGGVSRAGWKRLRSAAGRLRLGQASLLALGLATGLGCVGTDKHPEAGMVGTRRVLAMARPTEQPAPHQLQRLHAAFVRDDGTIVLQIQGKPVNAATSQPCTLELPAPARPAHVPSVARRIGVPSSALRLGWDDAAISGTNGHPLPVGPVMTIVANETYLWDAIALTEGRAEEIRLVQRLGTVSQWEILHLRAQPTAAQTRFTVFEVRPTMVPVNHRAVLALMPFALAEDAMTNVGSPVAKAGAIPAVGAVLFYTGFLPVTAAVWTCELLWKGAKAAGRGIGMGGDQSPP